METLVSIIVPHFRGASYLRDCLDSIVAQNFESLEVLLVSDGCGDEADKIAEEYGSLNIVKLSTGAKDGEPLGVAVARNLGIENSKGKYILFLDSDDFLYNETLSKMVEMAENNENVIIRARKRKTWYKRESALADEEERRLRRELMNEAKDDSDDELDDDGTDAGVISSDSQDDTENIDGIDSTEGLDVVTLKYRYGSSTAIGFLMPAKYVRGKYLRFSPGFRHYSDLPFMCELCEMIPFTTCKEALYFKRNHNDAIRMPSLTQEECENRLGEFIESYNVAWTNAREYLETGTEGLATLDDRLPLENVEFGSHVYKIRVAHYLEKFLLGYLVRKLTKKKHPKGLEWSLGELGLFTEYVKEIKKSNIKVYNMSRRRMLKRIGKGKLKAAMRTAKFYVMNKKKRGLLGSREQWKWNIYKRIFRKMSVKKDLYLFESFLGKSYGDSSRYIYEYMRKRDDESGNKNRQYVWIIDNKGAKIPGKHKQCKPMSLKFFYYVARAGVWVNNMRQPAWYEKREGVKFLETWHGTPLKKLVFDMDDVHSASPKYKMTFYKQSRIWDYLISDNAFSTNCFESAFLFDREKILELGYPRNDLLYGDDRDERAAKIKEKLGIPKDKKVVLYAPTWRDDDYYGPGQYKFDLPLDLQMMRKLKDEYFFVLRTHYFIADHLEISDEDKDFVMDQSRYNDIGELYLISDVLITDYSSVFFDFANLRRPILFYVYDFEKYASVLRGFYFDMTTGCPGPLLKTNEEVLEALENINAVSEEYKDKYDEFCSKFCYLDDGKAAERIVQKVFPGEF